ncbi:MAG: hypothetical protein LBE18_13080 [Planctomycetaceae bacterium]|jgi:hypothetical protein|nr:hypothetical protein [Planctomycetaceae bacterium]
MSNKRFWSDLRRIGWIDLSFRLSLFSLIFFVTLMNLFNAGVVMGQNFKSWAVDESLASKKDEIMTAMKQGNVTPSNRTEWNAFFDKYYFARWTVEGNMSFVQNYVRDLIIRDLKESTGNGRVFFLSKSLETLTKMANDKSLNPAARYNAILAIGQLTSKEAAGTDPPVFYEDALKQLIAIHDNNSTPEYLRVGALIGILRHAQAGISNDDYKNNKVPAIFIKTISTNSPVAEQDANEREKLDWVRIRAFDGLAALKVVNQNVITVVKDIIKSDLESYEIRCRAVRLMGELNLQSDADKIKQSEFTQVSNLLISFAKSYCDWEISKIDTMINKAFPAGQSDGINSAEFNRSRMSRMDSSVTGVMGTGEEITEPPFASLPPEVQREVMVIVQRVKSNALYFILFGMRGGRLSGPTSTGVITAFESGDPNFSKLNEATKAVATLIEILDKGKPETTTATRSTTTMARPTTGTTTPAVRGQCKVNFTIIREALKNCSDKLTEITTGKKVEPEKPKT